MSIKPGDKVKCKRCDGRGKVFVNEKMSPGTVRIAMILPDDKEIDCPTCKGKKYVEVRTKGVRSNKDKENTSPEE